MQVENIECQIAKAQLGRYIAGEGMAGEAIRQLEAHIQKCPDCKAVLDQKRSALTAVVSGAKESHPAPSAPKKPLAPGSSASRLAQAIMAKTAEEAAAKVVAQPAKAVVTAPEPPAKPTVNWKPIAYAGALAAVLIAMSYIGKADILGGKATNVLPDKAEASAPAVKPAAKAKPTPAVHAATPTPAPTIAPSPVVKATPAPVHVTAKPVVTQPKVVPTPKPAASHRHIVRPARHIKPARVIRRAPRHKVAHNRIRIYDEGGNAVN